MTVPIDPPASSEAAIAFVRYDGPVVEVVIRAGSLSEAFAAADRMRAEMTSPRRKDDRPRKTDRRVYAAERDALTAELAPLVIDRTYASANAAALANWHRFPGGGCEESKTKLLRSDLKAALPDDADQRTV